MNTDAAPSAAPAGDKPFKTLTLAVVEMKTRTTQGGMTITTVVGEETPGSGRHSEAVLFEEHAKRFQEAMAQSGLDQANPQFTVSFQGYWKKREWQGQDGPRSKWEFRVRDFDLAA